MEFIEEHSGEHWVSLSVSEFLSIGRIYADATLHKLVSFMLTSYLTQVKVYVYINWVVVNLVPAVANHFCLSLPAAFTQPGQSLLAVP